MSDLKHRSLSELIEDRTDCLRYIRRLGNRIDNAKSTLSGQEHRLQWIKHYVARKEAEKEKLMSEKMSKQEADASVEDMGGFVESISILLEKRSALSKRLVEALKYKTVLEMVHIITSFIPLAELEDIVKFQERD